MDFEKDNIDQKLKILELENLQLKKTILELQSKLLPYQYKEVTTLIDSYSKEFPDLLNSSN